MNSKFVRISFGHYFVICCLINLYASSCVARFEDFLKEPSKAIYLKFDNDQQQMVQNRVRLQCNLRVTEALIQCKNSRCWEEQKSGCKLEATQSWIYSCRIWNSMCDGRLDIDAVETLNQRGEISVYESLQSIFQSAASTEISGVETQTRPGYYDVYAPEDVKQYKKTH